MVYQLPIEIEETLKKGEDVDRELVANELIKRFKETNCSLPEYNIYSDQFDYDGEMIITCGDQAQWEIVVWSDGAVEPTTFYQGSIFDGALEIDAKEALLNPQLVMDQLANLVTSLCSQISFFEETEITFEDLEYDPLNREWI
jgi:hypothetical protein